MIYSSVLFLSCESKQDKSSRDHLSSTIRQINSNFQNYFDNRSAESLNMLQVHDFYSNCTNTLSELRNDLAKEKITKKFTGYYKLTDKIISDAIGYFNSRQKLMLKLFELNSNFIDYETYSDLSEVKNEISKAVTSFTQFVEEMQSNATKLGLDADSLTDLGIKLKFTDSLVFQEKLYDTLDFLYTTVSEMKKINKTIEQDIYQIGKDIETILKDMEEEMETNYPENMWLYSTKTILDKAYLKKYPDPNSETLLVLPKGTTVYVFKRDEDFSNLYYVRGGGKYGYINKYNLMHK